MTVPDGKGGFVHLHAYKEGIFGKLDSGDEVKRRLGFKADLHACPHEVQIHCNISSDHQGCPEWGGVTEAFNDCGAIVRLLFPQVGGLHYGLFLDTDPHYLRLDVGLQEAPNKTGAKHKAGVSPACWWNN